MSHTHGGTDAPECTTCGPSTPPLVPGSSRATIVQLETELCEARAEIDRLRRALHGHLFDGESLSTREAIREELIAQGLAAIDRLAHPPADLLALAARNLPPRWHWGEATGEEVAAAVLAAASGYEGDSRAG